LLRDVLISQRGIIFDMGRSFGDRDWIDPIAVSNRPCEFKMPPLSIAPKVVALPTESVTPHLVTVTDGAMIRGRMVDTKGKPVAGAEFGLSTPNRMSGRFFQDVRMRTNENGEFVITNVPPGRFWDLFPKMDALAPKGLTAPVTHVAAAGK
jgi:hypothetical protein